MAMDRLFQLMKEKKASDLFMSVNSPIAFMISLGYFYLVLTLLVYLLLVYANIPAFRKHAFLRSETQNYVRLALPAIFTLICVCSVVRSVS